MALGPVVYVQEQHPNLVETFIRAEINELTARSYNVWLATFKVLEENLGLCGYAHRVFQVSQSSAAEQISLHQPVYLHSHFITEAVKFALPIAEQLNVPFGFTAHAYDLWLRGHRIEPEVIHKLTQHPLCITAAVIGTKHKEYLRWCNVPEEKIVITPNSVDRRCLPAVRETPPQRVKKIIAVGRPIAKKGFFIAMDAVRLLKLNGYDDVELEIVGGADPGKPLGKVIAEYSSVFPFITATPTVSNEVALKKICDADVLVMPCMIAENGDSDGIPTVLAEAMLMGVPVVTADVGSITDLVIEGETGFIARTGDPAALAQKIVEVERLLQDRDRARGFLERAKARAAKHKAQSSVDVLVAHLEKQLSSPLYVKKQARGLFENH